MFVNPVSEITIKGYKSIRELDSFKLEKLNVLIGSNGAGKSNFIGIFKLLNEIAEGRLQTFVQKSGGAHTLLYKNQKLTDSIYIHVGFGLNAYECKVTSNANDGLFFEEERCYFHGPGYTQPYQESTFTDGKESGLQKKSDRPVVKNVLASILSWKVYHFHDTSENSEMKRLNDIADNKRLRPNASNLAAYLYLLQQKYKQDYENIVNTVKMVAPFFGGFNLHPLSLNSEKIQLEWKHNSSDAYFSASSLSDGTLRFICLATLLLQPKDNLPSTILLDEPELGLHPFAIKLLSNLLVSASTKTQIIVSTQSVTLINQLKPENIIVVDRDDEQSLFRRIDSAEMKEWVDNYGLGDLWEKNILGGRP